MDLCRYRSFGEWMRPKIAFKPYLSFRYQMIAANSCVHQIATRCIEGGDESKKDNVILYDFLRPGQDRRRRL